MERLAPRGRFLLYDLFSNQDKILRFAQNDSVPHVILSEAKSKDLFIPDLRTV